MDINIYLVTEYHTSENLGALKKGIGTVLGVPGEELPEVEIIPENERFSKLRVQASGTRFLEGIFIKIRTARIVEAVRQLFLKHAGKGGKNKLTFHLNKQAACVGKVHLASPGESALGTLEVTIETESGEELRRLVNWLAPPTKDGKVLEAGYDLSEKRATG
ncbi:MAG: hypothetical protein ACTSU5_07230 [Promethearchaeota archaeon]